MLPNFSDQTRCTTVVLHEPIVWYEDHYGCYYGTWYSENGDQLDATFERAPRLNGRILPVYGEDVREILENNARYILLADILLSPLAAMACGGIPDNCHGPQCDWWPCGDGILGCRA